MAGKRVAGSEAGAGSTVDALPVDNEFGGVTSGDDEFDTIPVVDPTTIKFEDDGGGGPARRKRGRPSGSSSRTSSAKTTKEGASDLTAILMSIHMMGATLLKVPELNLEQAEAEKLGKAIARVQSLYDMPILSEKQLAWINLLTVGGAVYGPRFIAYSITQKKKQAAKPNGATVEAPKPYVMQ